MFLPVAVVAGACGGGGTDIAELASTTTSTTGSTTTTVATTTTVSPEEELAAELPVISGYEFDDRAADAWNLSATTASVTRGIVLDGRWIGMLTMAGATPAETQEVWWSFVDEHHNGLPVVAAPPAAAAGGSIVSATLVPPAWEVWANELVLSTGDPGASGWTGAWHHAGRIWLVSGTDMALNYASELIAQQARTSDEPEQFDVEVLQGPLPDVLVDVPGFVYVDPPYDWVMSEFASFPDSFCFDHFSVHAIHPAGDPNPVASFDDADIELVLQVYSELDPCLSAEGLVASIITQEGLAAASVGPLQGGRGPGYLIFGANGINVDVYGTDAAIDAGAPFLEALAAALAAYQPA